MAFKKNREESIVFKKKDSVLSATPKFVSAEEDESTGFLEETPLNRYVLSLLDLKLPAGRQSLIANLPIKDLSYMYMVLPSILEKRIDFLYKKEKVEGELPDICSELTFKIGAHKGLTPLELYETKGLGAAEAQKKFLEDNLSKFAGNKPFIDALNAVIANGGRGVGSEIKEKFSGYAPITVYDQTKFLRSRKDAEGRCLIYKLKIQCELDKKYPWSIELENGFAPVATTSNGGANIEMNKAVNKLGSTYRLDDSDFAFFIRKMQMDADKYGVTTVPRLYEMAEKASYNNYKEAVNK